MKNLKRLLKFAFFFLFLIQNNLNAATCTALSDGYWNQTIWSCPGGPQAGDDIVIPAGIEVIIIGVVDLTTTGGTTPTNIDVLGKLTILDSSFGCFSNCVSGLDLDDNSKITINSVNGIDEKDRGGNAVPTITIGGNIVTPALPFGPGCINAAGFLPVDLIAFEGEQVDQSNTLYWSTASEENTDYFSVQRSTDGIDFKEIGTVRALGFTSEIQTYNFEDRAPEALSYYRLEIIDFDGLVTYSNVIVLQRNSDLVEVEVYPNPVIDDVNVKVNLEKDGPVEIKIFDAAGKVIQYDIYDLNQGLNKVIFDMKGLKHQLYIINISFGETTISKKIMTK